MSPPPPPVFLDSPAHGDGARGNAARGNAARGNAARGNAARDAAGPRAGRVTVPHASARGDRSGSPSGAAAAGPPVDPVTLGRWRARLDALTRWCLADTPLTPAAAAVAATARPTLGDLLRRALARAGDGVVDLLDAFDAPAEPARHQRLTRVLGGDVLLVVVTARGGVIERAEPRACRTAEEATALLGAFLGGAVAPWMATAGAHVRDALAGPLVLEPLDGGTPPSVHAAFMRLLSDPAAESTLVLPFLYLDGRAPAVAPPPVMLGMPAPGAPAPTVLGGVLRPGAAFLDAPPIGAPAPADDEEDEDDEEADEAVVEDAEAFVDDPALGAGLDLVMPNDEEEEEDVADEPPAARAEAASAALERLRARRAPADRVSVVVASDDGVAEHVGDAAAWLAGASEQELRALARAGWTGDAAVELALAADDPEVDDVARQARRHEAELVVEIDGDAAVAWLRRHRPDTAERLEAVL